MSYKLERMRREKGLDTKAAGRGLYGGTPEEERQRLTSPPRRRPIDRGLKFTLISFAAIAATLVYAKKMNPDISLGAPITMFAFVFLGCMIMSFISRRRK